MRRGIYQRIVGLFACSVLVLLSGCAKETTEHLSEEPAVVDHPEGSELAQITLTDKAIERIDLQTGTVAAVEQSPSNRIVPYSSLLYDSQGGTWVYTSPAPRTFVRHKVTVDRIKGNDVLLSDGPEVGTVIATVGVAELYGTEFAVGH